ncbi:hypothetical protein Neosp_005620 [[Neocosmospora] mangrovei]
MYDRDEHRRIFHRDPPDVREMSASIQEVTQQREFPDGRHLVFSPISSPKTEDWQSVDMQSVPSNNPFIDSSPVPPSQTQFQPSNNPGAPGLQRLNSIQSQNGLSFKRHRRLMVQQHMGSRNSQVIASMQQQQQQQPLEEQLDARDSITQYEANTDRVNHNPQQVQQVRAATMRPGQLSEAHAKARDQAKAITAQQVAQKRQKLQYQRQQQQQQQGPMEYLDEWPLISD